jgi:ATP-binding cassette subfamily F protein uup
MGRLERGLVKLDRQVAALHEQMAQQATDHVAVIDLGAQLRELEVERGAVEEQWLAAAEIVG